MKQDWRKKTTLYRLPPTVLMISWLGLFPLLAQSGLSVNGTIESTSGGLRFPDGSLQSTAATSGSAPVEDTGQQECFDPADTFDGRIDCLGTGQDGETQAGVDWPAPRFTNNRDGTVTDKLTGLVWLQDTHCTLFFEERRLMNALAAARDLSQGFCGLTDGSQPGDWRLPNIKELLSLVHHGTTSPALPSGHPFTRTDFNSFFWSSTTRASEPTQALYLAIGGGNHLATDKASPVRNPSATPPESSAPISISTDGLVESSVGGFKFPDGSVQTTAAGARSAPVERTGQETCYDPSGATADEIPCAGTGQDGELQAGVFHPDPRFTDNLDGTVTDHLTDLVWLKDANCFSFFATLDFDDALSEANLLGEGFCGLIDGSQPRDWRLPNAKELLSLIDHGRFSPALPQGHPFVNVDLPNVYWASTSDAGNASAAWAVDFFEGTDRVALKSARYLVWPVRGGH